MAFDVPSDYELAQAMAVAGGPEAMPYRQDFLNNVYGPTPFVNGAGFYGPGETSWRSDPARNPALQRSTVDDQVLAYNEMAHNLAQDAFKRAQITQSKQRINTLRGLQNTGQSPNLFGKPTTQQEADLQKFIQQDLNAGYAGWKFIPTAAQKRALARQQQQDALKVRAQNLAEAKFRASTGRNTTNDQFNQDYKAAQFNDLTNYRAANLGTKQYGQDQAAAMGQARLTQQQANQQRRAMSQAEQTALKAVYQGMNPNDAAQLYGLDQNGAARLAGWANTYDANDQYRQGQTQNVADALNQAELDMRRQSYVPPTVSWYDRITGNAPAPVDVNTLGRSQLPQPMNRQQLDKLIAVGAKQGLAYDPAQGFVPMIRSSRMQGNGGQRQSANLFDQYVVQGYDPTQDPAFQDQQRFLNQNPDTSSPIASPRLMIGGYSDRGVGSPSGAGQSGDYPVFSSSAEVQDAVRSGYLNSGDIFLDPDDNQRQVP